jgi:[Skp1-protein]-hydroxyproline N-acetylglucosaminyltransferase
MNRIFVSIASYRDKKCSATLQSLFSNAKHPQNVFVGICHQNKKGEDLEICTMKPPTTSPPNTKSVDVEMYNNNISVINVDYTDAKGPTWARYLCSTLWNGEEYFLQIDSHVLFVKDWDEKCIRMITEIQQKYGNQKVLLSHYTSLYEQFDQPNPNNNVPRICQSFFNDRGMISFMGAESLTTGFNEYNQSPYIAAGFIFAPSSFIVDVPFDPYLDYVFVGEEILLSARAFTSGYNVYTPSENICFHYYTREGESKIWDDKSYSDQNAFDNIKKILKLQEGNPNVHDRYNLGKERTLQQFYDYAGIDIKNKTVVKNFCRESFEADTISQSGYSLFWVITVLVVLVIIGIAILFLVQ